MLTNKRVDRPELIYHVKETGKCVHYQWDAAQLGKASQVNLAKFLADRQRRFPTHVDWAEVMHNGRMLARIVC